MKDETETIGTIILDGIALVHRRFYESGHPTASTVGERDGNTYSIFRSAETPDWSLFRLDGGWILVRQLTEAEIAEHEAIREATPNTRRRHADCEPEIDDLTTEAEAGRISGAMPVDL